MSDEIRNDAAVDTGAAAAAAADPLADLAAAAPSLSFGEPEPEAAQAQEAAVVQAPPQQEPEEAVLTPEELKMVDAFVKQIDITNTQAVMTYGVGTQKKMADFSEKTLESVKTKDLGEVGGMITSLVTELKNFDVEEEEKVFSGLKRNQQNAGDEDQVQQSRDQCRDDQQGTRETPDPADEGHRPLGQDDGAESQLLQRASMYILAVKESKRLREKATELQQKAQRSGLPEDAQAASDF